jgi:hypothetical protein
MSPFALLKLDGAFFCLIPLDIQKLLEFTYFILIAIIRAKLAFFLVHLLLRGYEVQDFSKLSLIFNAGLWFVYIYKRLPFIDNFLL